MVSSNIWYENVLNSLSILGYTGSALKNLEEDYIVFYYKNRGIFIDKGGRFYEYEEWKYYKEGTGSPNVFCVNGEKFVTYSVKPNQPGESAHERTVNVKDMRTISNIEIFHIADYVRRAILQKQEVSTYKYTGDLSELDEFRIPYKKIDDASVELSNWFFSDYLGDDFFGLNPMKRIKLALRY